MLGRPWFPLLRQARGLSKTNDRPNQRIDRPSDPPARRDRNSGRSCAFRAGRSSRPCGRFRVAALGSSRRTHVSLWPIFPSRYSISHNRRGNNNAFASKSQLWKLLKPPNLGATDFDPEALTSRFETGALDRTSPARRVIATSKLFPSILPEFDGGLRHGGTIAVDDVLGRGSSMFSGRSRC